MAGLRTAGTRGLATAACAILLATGLPGTAQGAQSRPWHRPRSRG